jgi:HPt (histidine-containing phosphotransfer) domain-containing protein
VGLAHALRGAAATLGATALALAAQRLELGLRGDGGDGATIEADAQAAQGALSALAAALPEATPAGAASRTAPDAVAAQSTRDAVDALLARSDTTAITLFDEHAQALQAALGPAFDALARQIRHFAVDEARATRRQLRPTL